MDGRTQLPIIHWLKEKYGFSFVDTITEPGMDKLFSNVDKVSEIKTKTSISVKAHGSQLILISGHHDCAGNPVSKQEHLRNIESAMKIIRSWNFPVKVVGAWINEDWELELITN